MTVRVPAAAAGQVVADAAEVYERSFVHALFAQWTTTMIATAGVQAGDRVLDIACGTGVLTRAAATRVGPAGSVVGLDRNPGMLAVAGRSPAPITWDQGMAEQLPYPSGSFDRVLCQFGLMFFDDRERALAEMARVLAPGGRVAIATWCAVEESPGYAMMVDLLRRIVDESAAQTLLAPFSLGTVAAVRALIAPVFPEVRVRRHAGTAAFAPIEEWLHTDIRGWTLADRIDDATYARLLAAARDALDGYASEDGVRFAAPALIASTGCALC